MSRIHLISPSWNKCIIAVNFRSSHHVKLIGKNCWIGSLLRKNSRRVLFSGFLSNGNILECRPQTHTAEHIVNKLVMPRYHWNEWASSCLFWRNHVKNARCFCKSFERLVEFFDRYRYQLILQVNYNIFTIKKWLLSTLMHWYIHLKFIFIPILNNEIEINAKMCFSLKTQLPYMECNANVQDFCNVIISFSIN